MAIKIENIEVDGNYMEFTVKGISRNIANMLRRYLINGVEVVAIDKVVFYENTSSFFDEYIAHRLGMVPIIADDEVDVNEVGMYADVTGEKMFYSGDLKSTDKRVKVALENIPIVKLLEGQSLRIEVKLRKGKGREHAKFQSGIASYEESNGSYRFFVETLHHFDPKTLLRKALENMERDLEELEKNF